MIPPKKALFLTNRLHIGEGKGGVQRCTAEYLSTIKTMGMEVEILQIGNDQRLDTKIFRRINSSPYFRPVAKADLRAIIAAAKSADIIFLNQVALCAIAQSLKQVVGPAIPIIALSHGCEITDLLHQARLMGRLPLSGQLRPTPTLAMARVLADEVAARQHVDGVVALSDYDAQTETWLGTRQAIWLPRTVAVEPLTWAPISGRFGFVGTFDHAPSLESLVAVLEEVEKRAVHHVSIRIVGTPPRLGNWLVQKYSCVTYLGPLSDPDLIEEAKTWQAFLNPIFCQARGCSTKLAMALGWQIPVLTTTIGRRGYVWTDGGVIEANDAGAFVTEMLGMASGSRSAIDAQSRVQAASLSTPSLAEVARTLDAFCQRVAPSSSLGD